MGVGCIWPLNIKLNKFGADGRTRTVMLAHTPLKRACLPISPHPQSRKSYRKQTKRSTALTKKITPLLRFGRTGSRRLHSR